MAVGGLGSYDPKLRGFVSDNSPASDQMAGWMDTVERTSAGFKRDTIDGEMHTWTESGNYGAAWASFTEASDLPPSPAMGRGLVGRINLDDSPDTYRLYWYSGTNWIIISSGNV